MDLDDQFWSKIQVTPCCWIWTKGLTSEGYGQHSIWRPHKTYLVHRLVFESLVGPIPPRLTLDHLCRQRSCCNPGHLEPVTKGENTRRGVYLRPLRLTCPKGHLYTRENLYQRANGKRTCRECWLTSARQRRLVLA